MKTCINLALHKKVSGDGIINPDVVTNGQITGYGCTRKSKTFADFPCGKALTVDLDKIFSVKCIRFLLWDGMGSVGASQDPRRYEYALETSIDGNKYFTQYTAINSESSIGWQQFMFKRNFDVRYIRINGISNTANNSFHIVEVEAYEMNPPHISAEIQKQIVLPGQKSKIKPLPPPRDPNPIYSDFQIDNIPNWKCPSCGNILHSSKNDISSFESANTIKYKNDENFEPESYDGLFSLKLICTNPNCKETVILSGKEDIRRVEIEDEYGFQEDFQSFLIPKFFIPNLKLFEIPQKTPNEIRNLLNSSFQLFYCNQAASANIARIALEKVLDNLKVKRFTKRRKRLALHNRIEVIPSKYSHLKNRFFAIKWLGNEGSHDNRITKDDISDLYIIFHDLLMEVYGNRNEITSIVKDINKRKGPIKRKP